jgi:hypothetical protein
LLLHTLADIPNLPGAACVEHRDRQCRTALAK